jgi:hypothetical protein
MNRSLFQAVIFLSLCPLLMAQQQQADSTEATALSAQTAPQVASISSVEQSAKSVPQAASTSIVEQPAYNVPKDASTNAVAQPAQAIQITGSLQLTQDASTQAIAAERLAQMKRREAEQPHYTDGFNRNATLKNARTIFICSETAFLTNSTMQRALFNQKDWEKLGLNILNNNRDADLQLQINRVVFTHIHT